MSDSTAAIRSLIACAVDKGSHKMARTTVEVTQSEIEAYARFAKERGIIHDGSADDQHNADFVLNYFLTTWNVEMTEQNLNYAWERIHPHLKLYTSAQADW